MTEQLDRLHRCLVDALHERPPGDPDRPVTVGDIYRDLVPYAAVRKTLGVGLNADYEHVLLRLLAGEGGRVEVQSSDARQELQSELESPNPDVGVFREYAACDVRVRMPDDAGTGAGAPEPAAPDAPDAAADGASDDAPPDAAREPTAPSGRACPFCLAHVPGGPSVRFCPFCGESQRMRPCPACGAAIDPDWRFCVACGTTTSSEDAAAAP